MNKIPDVSCTYYRRLSDTKPETNILFVNSLLNIDEINKIMDNCYNECKNLKLICLLGDKENKDSIKKYPGIYRVWLIDDSTTYDNGFINTYDILCRDIGNQFKEMEYNYSFSLKDGQINSILIF